MKNKEENHPLVVLARRAIESSLAGEPFQAPGNVNDFEVPAGAFVSIKTVSYTHLRAHET